MSRRAFRLTGTTSEDDEDHIIAPPPSRPDGRRNVKPRILDDKLDAYLPHMGKISSGDKGNSAAAAAANKSATRAVAVAAAPAAPAVASSSSAVSHAVVGSASPPVTALTSATPTVTEGGSAAPRPATPPVSVQTVADEDELSAKLKDKLPPNSPQVMEEVVMPRAIVTKPPAAGVTVISDSDGENDASAGEDDAGTTDPRRPAAGKRKRVVSDTDSDSQPTAAPREKSKKPRKKRAKKVQRDSDSESDTATARTKKKKRSKKTKPTTLANPQEVDDNGLLKDLNVIDLDEVADDQIERTRDIRAHFGHVYSQIINGTSRQVRNCNICVKSNPLNAAKVAHGTTLRRHMESFHKDVYLRWCKENDFESMLPGARKRQRNAALLEAEARLQQSSLDAHLVEKERVVPYSDALFQQVSLEWVAETDQPIAALRHPKFREMIAVASRAKDGVRIPSGYQARKGILRAFQDHIADLKKRLNSPQVKGKISTTCDAWESDPGDSYFAVTGHWIEETDAGLWGLKCDLFGFVHMPYSHNGTRLGQALFKVLDRIGVAHKLGWVTCDNASNMTTMMGELQKHVVKAGNKGFLADKRRIRCLAHVINLATQALISAYGDQAMRAPGTRDVIDIVREISVKEQSSSQRRQNFLDIQRAAECARPLHLMKDMKVRWSSTKNMIQRAYKLREHIGQFVTELERLEKDRKKRDIISKLHLSDEEWSTVKLVLELLELPDCAQQAFSAETYSTLYNAVPALLSLLHAWEARSLDRRYVDLWEALAAATDKLKYYVEELRTSTNDAYHMAMVLHPVIKLGPDFAACWSDHESRRTEVEKMFAQRYSALNCADPNTLAPKPKPGALRSLLSELRPSTSMEPSATQSPTEAWRVEFESYLRSDHDIPEGMSLVRWWGMNLSRFPTWASIAADYLAAMAASVSSERIFSSAGETITKRRNRLQSDLVEALQVIKAALRSDLLLRPAQPSSALEEDLEKKEAEEAMLDLDDGPAGGETLDARKAKLERLLIGLEFDGSEDEGGNAE